MAFAAAAAALTVAAAGALAFAVRNTAPPPLDQPGTAVTPEASGKTQPESAASPGAAVSAPGKTVTGIPGATGVASATEPTQTIDLPGSLQISQVFPADWDYEMDVWIDLGRYDEETNTIYATMRNDTDFACTYGMGFSLLRRENRPVGFLRTGKRLGNPRHCGHPRIPWESIAELLPRSLLPRRHRTGGLYARSRGLVP